MAGPGQKASRRGRRELSHDNGEMHVMTWNAWRLKEKEIEQCIRDVVAASPAKCVDVRFIQEFAGTPKACMKKVGPHHYAIMSGPVPGGRPHATLIHEWLVPHIKHIVNAGRVMMVAVAWAGGKAIFINDHAPPPVRGGRRRHDVKPDPADLCYPIANCGQVASDVKRRRRSRCARTPQSTPFSGRMPGLHTLY